MPVRSRGGIRPGVTLQPRAEPVVPEPPSNPPVLGVPRVVEESVIETNSDGEDVESERRAVLDASQACNKVKRFQIEDEATGLPKWVYATVSKKPRVPDPDRPGNVRFGRANFTTR